MESLVLREEAKAMKDARQSEQLENLSEKLILTRTRVIGIIMKRTVFINIIVII